MCPWVRPCVCVCERACARVCVCTCPLVTSKRPYAVKSERLVRAMIPKLLTNIMLTGQWVNRSTPVPVSQTQSRLHTPPPNSLNARPGRGKLKQKNVSWRLCLPESINITVGLCRYDSSQSQQESPNRGHLNLFQQSEARRRNDIFA